MNGSSIMDESMHERGGESSQRPARRFVRLLRVAVRAMEEDRIYIQDVQIPIDINNDVKLR